MTDLSAYDTALVERVARAICELTWAPLGEWPEYTDEATAALTALGLIGPSRTAWIAPWEASEGMVAKVGRRVLLRGVQPSESIYVAMRDAHMKEGGA